MKGNEIIYFTLRQQQRVCSLNDTMLTKRNEFSNVLQAENNFFKNKKK